MSNTPDSTPDADDRYYIRRWCPTCNSNNELPEYACFPEGDEIVEVHSQEERDSIIAQSQDNYWGWEELNSVYVAGLAERKDEDGE